MAQGQIGSLLRHIRRIIGAAAPADTTDARLLEQFCRQGDEPAFAALVRRHGPLVIWASAGGCCTIPTMPRTPFRRFS